MRTLLITSRVSNSGTALARALGIRKLALTGAILQRDVRLINWGCGLGKFNERYVGRAHHPGVRFINETANVSIASNKLLTFQALSSNPAIPIPEFTASDAVANQWYVQGDRVVGRTILTGHSGEGIFITDPLNYPQGEGGVDVIALREVHGNIPLYVKYKKKKHEYRVHVVLNGVNISTDVQQKRKRQETPNEEVDYKVRNHANGWVYCREDLHEPEGLQDLAIQVVRQLSLDFGAVDIIWNEHENQMYVLEVNTAPGLEGQTLEFYAQHLGEMM